MTDLLSLTRVMFLRVFTFNMDVAEGGKTKEKSNLHANVLMAAAARSKGIGQNLTALQLLRNAY